MISFESLLWIVKYQQSGWPANWKSGIIQGIFQVLSQDSTQDTLSFVNASPCCFDQYSYLVYMEVLFSLVRIPDALQGLFVVLYSLVNCPCSLHYQPTISLRVTWNSTAKPPWVLEKRILLLPDVLFYSEMASLEELKKLSSDWWNIF